VFSVFGSVSVRGIGSKYVFVSSICEAAIRILLNGDVTAGLSITISFLSFN
jgi:hypothetical protein